MTAASPSTSAAPSRWVVYSTFDAQGAPARFATDQVAAYRDAGFDVLVVDTSPTMSPERAAGWDTSSTCWLQRDNVGYDFGSYREGLQVLTGKMRLAIHEIDVLFTNDSCYGPYAPLGDIFAGFDATPRDGRTVFAMTDSNERGRHLQSWWLYFRADALPLAASYFATVPAIGSRSEAVEFGELGLSRHLVAQGCRLVPWVAMDETVRHYAHFHGRWLSLLELGLRWKLKRPRYSVDGDRACLKLLLGRPYISNVTVAFGTHLHFQAKLPFIKRQLVRENPKQDPFVPATPPSDARDNACVDRWLRKTDRYRRRYDS